MTSLAEALGAKLQADSELRRAAATFFLAADTAGIPAAPLKGLALSAALYDDPLERPFGDVDVLVRFRDLHRVRTLARRARFEIVYDSKQLGTLNVIVPPGIAIDVRASLGPPGFMRVSAGAALSRAVRTTDLRVCAAPIRWLDPHDHLLFLVVDALIDKLTVSVRAEDLARGLARWVRDPVRFVDHLNRAGLVDASRLVFGWVQKRTGSADAATIARLLGDLPRSASLVSGALSRLDVFERNPHGLLSRFGVRLLADDPTRAVASLGLGLLGIARYRVNNSKGDPWAARALERGS